MRPWDIFRNVEKDVLMDPVRLGRDVISIFRQHTTAMQNDFELAQYLSLLAPLNIRSYLEIGVTSGGSFIPTVEVLNRLGPGIERARGIDIDFQEPVITYSAIRSGTRLWEFDMRNSRFTNGEWMEMYDLVLVGGDLSEENCRRNVQTVLPWTRYIAMRDIANPNLPSVARTWSDLKATFRETCVREIIDPHDPIGIGIISTKEPFQ